MMQILIWLNQIANAIGSVALAPIEYLPGWLSATFIAGVTGVGMLVVFKYTSNQSAIKRTRDQIKANLLAISLFKDHLGVSFRCQGRLLWNALILLWHSLLPVVVMTVPMALLLGQIALWYQARPLAIDEESIVTVHLKPGDDQAMDQIELVPSDAIRLVSGPVRVPAKKMVCWNVSPSRVGLYRFDFRIGSIIFSKDIAVGGQFKPVSLKRPPSEFGELLVHPREEPFRADSLVQSIEISYPERKSFTSGTNMWVIYWFIVSMIAAFAAKPFLNVNI